MKNISVATRIAIAIMLVAVVALTVTFVFSSGNLDRLFEATLNARFAATRDGKTDELTRYLASIERRTADLAESPMTIDAVKRFSDAYRSLPIDSTGSRDSAIETLLPIYRDEYLPALTEARGH